MGKGNELWADAYQPTQHDWDAEHEQRCDEAAREIVLAIDSVGVTGLNSSLRALGYTIVTYKPKVN